MLSAELIWLLLFHKISNFTPQCTHLTTFVAGVREKHLPGAGAVTPDPVVDENRVVYVARLATVGRGGGAMIYNNKSFLKDKFFHTFRSFFDLLYFMRNRSFNSNSVIGCCVRSSDNLAGYFRACSEVPCK